MIPKPKHFKFDGHNRVNLAAHEVLRAKRLGHYRP